MTSPTRAQALTSLNLTAIFGERDVAQRKTNIADLWVPSGEAFFVDPTGVFKTHGDISAMVDRILGMGGEGHGFWELSKWLTTSMDV